MNYSQTLEFLFSSLPAYETAGATAYKPGLERIAAFCRHLGNPQRNFFTIHVAGTNGKGSVTTMLTKILVESGFKTGTYMSPALESFNERIRIDEQPIPDPVLIHLADRVQTAGAQLEAEGEPKPTGFEIETAIALLYFKEAGCDICVFEVGLGGRLDATNIIPSPEAAVITSISLEHTEYLGDTCEKIAGEKAGIIKEDCSVIIYPQAQSVEQVIREAAQAAGAREVVTAVPGEIACIDESLSGQKLAYHSVAGAGDAGEFVFDLRLAGAHQQLNCLTVLKTVGVLRNRGWNIPDDAVRRALATVRFPGRLELLSEEPVVLIDGAHNPNGIQSLANNIAQYLPDEKIDLYFGMLADKNIDLALDLLLPYAGRIFTLTPDSEEAVKAEEMAEKIRIKTKGAVPVVSLPDAEAAVRGVELRPDAKPVVFTGSLYMIGHVRSEWHRLYPEI